MNRRFVGRWVTAVALCGEAALAGGRRGRRPGEQKALSAAQLEGLPSPIVRGRPYRFGLSFALWTRVSARRSLIARETGSCSTSGWSAAICGPGVSLPERPARQATERRDEAVRAWLGEHPSGDCSAKPRGEKAAKSMGADETGLSSRANYGLYFAPKGHTPVIRLLGKGLFLVDDFEPHQPGQAALHDR